MKYEVIDTQIAPDGHLDVLSKSEVARLLDTSNGGLYQLFRSCALAVLNSGSGSDDGKELLERYQDFDISIIQRERGIKLNVKAAPAAAFVDGVMIKGIQEHLFAVLRDILFTQGEIVQNAQIDLNTTKGITDAVFQILRNAKLMNPLLSPNMVVCWGGHSISGIEYDYTKLVGYHLALREMDICTGCGPGAMKGPMKGATIGHAKQRSNKGRYVGISEPGIIAAEAPNAIVNDLIIMPDIEKRLEAFVRFGHAIIVFPGGAGTAEEILYILGILLHPDNAGLPFPLIFTGPESSAEYFKQIDQFVGDILGEQARSKYQIIVNDPERVAREVQAGIKTVRTFRKQHGDAYYFNWLLKIDTELQHPFEPTHSNMRGLQLHKNQAPHLLAAQLRRAFSGVVAGNVKDQGIRAIEKHGLFEICGDPDIMKSMDILLTSFVEQSRMKLPGTAYKPCYKVIL